MAGAGDPIDDVPMLQAMFESAALGIALVDGSGRPLRCNPALERMLGYSAAELASMTFDQLTHPDDVEGDRQRFAELLAGGVEHYRIDKRYLRKDGSVVRARLTASVWRRGADGLLGVGLVEDITDDLAARARQAELFAKLGERVKELAALHRCAELLRNTDRPLGELLAAIAALMPPAFQQPDEIAACLEYQGQAYATDGYGDGTCIRVGLGDAGGALTVVLRRPDATPFLAEEQALVRSVADMVGGELCRRAAEEELRRSNERLGLALSTAAMGVWEWDVRAGTVVWSEQAARLVGADRPLIGRFDDFSGYVHPDDRDRTRAALLGAAERTGPHDFDLAFRLAHPGGGWRRIEATARVLPGPDGRAARVVGVMADVTRRRALEEELLQAQKMEAIGHSAGGIAHDFNNLLSVMSINCQLLLAGERLAGAERGLIEELRAAVDSGTALTRQLLAFSRRSPHQPAAVEVDALLGRLEPLLRRVAGPEIALELALSCGPAQVWIDASQLEQVVMNLVVNARDATAGAGSIRIGTEVVAVDDDHAARHAGARPGRHVVIAIADSGAGIDAATRARLFEPFFTTKGEGLGTGLGLAVVYGVVRQSGGHLTVDSEVGRGATFRVYLPCHPAAG